MAEQGPIVFCTGGGCTAKLGELVQQLQRAYQEKFERETVGSLRK